MPYLFGDIACASHHPEATLALTGELLERAYREERGRHLALISMDPASSETTRELADDALEELLEHPHVSEFIENRLFSKCLPEDALWRGEGTFGGSQYNVKLEFLKRSVVGAQEAIGRVRSAWDALPADLFAEADDRVALEPVLEETGAFRDLAMQSRRPPIGTVRAKLNCGYSLTGVTRSSPTLGRYWSNGPGRSRVRYE
jgi:hypothetical protein